MSALQTYLNRKRTAVGVRRIVIAGGGDPAVLARVQACLAEHGTNCGGRCGIPKPGAPSVAQGTPAAPMAYDSGASQSRTMAAGRRRIPCGPGDTDPCGSDGCGPVDEGLDVPDQQIRVRAVAARCARLSAYNGVQYYSDDVSTFTQKIRNAARQSQISDIVESATTPGAAAVTLTATVPENGLLVGVSVSITKNDNVTPTPLAWEVTATDELGGSFNPPVQTLSWGSQPKMRGYAFGARTYKGAPTYVNISVGPALPVVVGIFAADGVSNPPVGYGVELNLITINKADAGLLLVDGGIDDLRQLIEN